VSIQPPTIILGASARGAAGSVVRAGGAPWAVDLFADRDTQAMGHVRRVRRYPAGLLEKVWSIPGAPVLLTGAMERHPAVVRAIERRHPLIGPNAAQMQAMRCPMVWRAMPPTARWRVPAIAFDRPERFEAGRRASAGGRRLVGGARWIVKRWRSGRCLGWYTPGRRLGAGRYLQEYAPGMAMGAVYRVCGGRAELFGVTRQIVGEPAFRAPRWAYAGSIGPVSLDADQRAALAAAGQWLLSVTGPFEGVFGSDVVRDIAGDLWPIEANPRYTASVELCECLQGRAALAGMGGLPGEAHAAAPRRVGVAASAAPAEPWESTPRGFAVRPESAAFLAKGVLFSPIDARLPRAGRLLPRGVMADIPQPWRRIRRGGPICTLFASGDSHEASLAQLRETSRTIYTALRESAQSIHA